MHNEELNKELYNFTEELLGAKQEVRIKVQGNSMYPFLKESDVVVVLRCDADTLKPGDIIGFKSSGKWVAHRLHRIQIIDGRKIFYTKGDACLHYDKPFELNNFIGKVISFERRKKIRKINSPGNKIFSKLVVALASVFSRLFLFRLRNEIRVKKAIGLIKDIFKNLTFVGQKSRGLIAINLLLTTLQGVLPLAIIYLVKLLVDRIGNLTGYASKHEALVSVLILIAITGVLFLMQSVVSVLISERREKLNQSVSLFIFGLLHKKYASLDMAHLEDSNRQDKIHRAVQEAGFRPIKMLSESFVLVQSIVSWIFIAALLFTVHWTVFPLILLAVIPGFLVRVVYAGKIYRMTKENSQKEREGFYYNRILTSIPFAKELRLFSLEHFFTSRFETIQKDLHFKKNKIIRIRTISDIFSQLFAVVLIFSSFGFVSYMAVEGTISIGTVVLFFLLFQRGFSVMKDMFQSFANLIEDQVFFADFNNFLNLETLHEVSAVNNNNLPSIQHGIRIENLSFQYPSSSRKALNNVSFEIPKGKTVALVGANGSGKTTLIKLLCGFYKADEGAILFDSTNINNYSSENLRKEISVVFQDFALYNLSAAENIGLGKIEENASMEKIKNAAENAGIADVIEKLPNGYQTLLGNLFAKGEELSIGQWQKLAIAKAFYRNTSILFMDEPSSALDAETEFQLLQKLKLLAADKTVLIISHRLSSIKWADNIVVMDNGEIVEQGSHKELMEAKNRYYAFYEASRNG